MLKAAVSSCLEEQHLPVKEILELSDGNPAAFFPYHNNEHCLLFAVNAYSIGKNLKLNSYELKHLLVAGIFHDFDHTGGSTPDVNNILRALKFIHAKHDFFVNAGLTPFYLRQLIQATQNPPRDMYTVSEHIMRDADLLGWCEPETSHMRHGLSTELGIPVTIRSTKSFLNNAFIHTKQARNKLFVAGWIN
jgi:hypothetical protein